MLSLVVPVYNVARFLPQCLDSLARLSPAADQIIAVDDGSTDKCSSILQSYSRVLPQMSVIRQENGGLSAARNTGLDAATGRYLAFVDSDDFVEPDAYAEAVTLAERDRLDMVLLNATYHFEGRRPDYSIYPDSQATKVLTGREWMRQRLRGGRFLHMVWMHLYRRDFIEQNGFRFVPRLIHEDVIWTTRALLAASRIRYLPHAAVSYRVPNRYFAPAEAQKRLQAILESSVFNARNQVQLALEVKDDKELHQLLQRQLVDGALSIFHILRKMPDRAFAAKRLAELRREGFLALLWANAHGADQHRRVAKQWIRSLLVPLVR